MEATVRVKGQVVIPAEIRRRLGVKQGIRLRVEEHDGAIIMRPITRDYFERMSGILDGASAVAVLEKSRYRGQGKERRRSMEKKVAIKAVEMVRAIRDKHARQLGGKSDEEVLTFYRKAAAGVLRGTTTKSKSPVTTLRELRGAVTSVGRRNFSAERAKAKSAVAK